MTFEHLGDLDHGLELTPTHPAKPIFEKPAGPTRLLILREFGEQFFRRPRPFHLQGKVLQRRKLRDLLPAEILRVMQPQLPGAFERRIPLGTSSSLCSWRRTRSTAFPKYWLT